MSSPEPISELARLVLQALASRSNWSDVSENPSHPVYTHYTAYQDPALLAQATLDGDEALVKALLTGTSLDPFTRELQALLAVQRASDYRPGWVLNQLFETFPETTLTREPWKRLGDELNDSPGWAYQKWQVFGGAKS